MAIQTFDKLNNITNEEWFADYPYDSDLRIKYANELQGMLEEYFLDRIDNRTEIKRDDFSFLFLIWLGFVANDQYNKHELATQLFEHDFGFSLFDRANRIADVLYGSSETARFNSMLSLDDDYPLLENVYTRAITVARNETTGLANEMLHQEAINEGYLYHVWVATIDKSTRDSHREADGQIREINEPFEVGGSYLMFPNDDSLGADPSELVNCRCIEEFCNEKGEFLELTEQYGILRYDLQYFGERETVGKDFVRTYTREITPVPSKAKEYEIVNLKEYTRNGVRYKYGDKGTVFNTNEQERFVMNEYGKTYGGVIERIFETNASKVPDFRHLGIEYEIKAPSRDGDNTVYNWICKCKEKSPYIILDIRDYPRDYSETVSQIDKALTTYNTRWVQSVTTYNGKQFETFRRGK